MNETVSKLLNNRLSHLENDIKWEREALSDLALRTISVGKHLDYLTAERRAIKDHLEASA